MTPAPGRKPQEGTVLGQNHGHALWCTSALWKILLLGTTFWKILLGWKLGIGAGPGLTAVRGASPAPDDSCPISLLPEQKGLTPESLEARSLSTYQRGSINPRTAGLSSGTNGLRDLGQIHSLL